MSAPKSHVEFDTRDVYPNGRPKGILLSRTNSLYNNQDQMIESDDLESQLASEKSLRRTKQTFTGWTLAWLSYQSLGVIYGDIGTSPLYVFSSTFTSQPSFDDLVGALSIIIWSLTLIVSVKYVFIVLQADDDGEGGTFALYSLIARYCSIGQQDPINSKTIKMERYATNDLSRPHRSFRTIIEKSKTSRVILQFAGVIGVSMLMADGVLTPAQSVLGAIQGIRVIKPDLDTSVIMGVSCAIIVLLFAIQPLGISKVASAFAPVVIIWLLFNFCFGIYNLAVHDHRVLKAFSPFFAGDYLVRNGTDGWKSLGGLLLAFTGVEAMFADIGAFGIRAVQISWLAFAYPCLLLAYIGQAAFISTDPTQEAFTNPFFLTLPPHMFWPSLIFSILAAIVASQAIITGTFQLLSQIMNLSFFPRLPIVHTSKKFHGQIYIALPNWLMMIGTVIITAVYNNTTSLGNAYGVCVIFVTFLTTCMVAVVALIVWRINVFIVLFVFLVFGLLDGVYLSAVLVKVPEGAWLTLVIAFVLASTCALYNYCKKIQWKTEESALSFNSYKKIKVGSQPNFDLYYNGDNGSRKMTNIGGICVFIDKGTKVLPIVAEEFFKNFQIRHDIVIFFHLRPINVPVISDADRFVVSRTFIPNCYRVVVRYGYAEDITKDDLGAVLYEQLKQFLQSEVTESASEDNSHIKNAITLLEMAYHDRVIYIKPKENFIVDQKYSIVKRYLLQLFAWVEEFTPSPIDEMVLPAESIVEIGYNRHI